MKRFVLIIGIFLSIPSYGKNKEKFIMDPNKYVYNNQNDTIFFNNGDSEIYTLCYPEYAIKKDTVLNGTARNPINISGSYPLHPRGWECDSITILDSIQIDGKGLKELIFYRRLSGIAGAHGGTFDIEETFELEKIEIWNIDTKKLYFEAAISCRCSFHRSHSYHIIPSLSGIESFDFKYKISTDGTIYLEMISNVVDGTGYYRNENKYKPLDYQLCPAISEGYYIFINDNYIKKK